VKRIYISRHAKSSWEDHRLRDIDRPLNDRGRKDAPKMARLCLERGYVPSQIIASNSKRTTETARYFQKTFNLSHIDLDSSLYLADSEQYIETCFGLDENQDSVMMFGHNPGITDLANYFFTETRNVPTCGILVFDCDVKDWSMVSKSKMKLIDFLYPKMNL